MLTNLQNLQNPDVLRRVAYKLETSFFDKADYSRDSAIGTKIESAVLKLRQVSNVLENDPSTVEETKPSAYNIRSPNSLRQTAFDLESAYFRSDDKINPNSELAQRLIHAIATLRWAAELEGGMKEPATWDSFQVDDLVPKDKTGNVNTKFNINKQVRVRLTVRGWAILKEKFEEENAQCGIRDEFVPPNVDGEGYVKFQLYRLMEIFGKHTTFTNQIMCFQGNDIIIDQIDTVVENIKVTKVPNWEDLSTSDKIALYMSEKRSELRNKKQSFIEREMLEEILQILKPADPSNDTPEGIGTTHYMHVFKTLPDKKGDRINQSQPVYRIHSGKVNLPNEKGELKCILCETRGSKETVEHWCHVITDDFGDSFVCHKEDWKVLNSFDHLTHTLQALCDICPQTAFYDDNGYIQHAPIKLKWPDIVE